MSTLSPRLTRWHLLLLLFLSFIAACASPTAVRLDQPQSGVETANLKSAVRTTKPQPQAWEIRGIVAAAKDTDPEVRAIAFRQLTTYDLESVQNRDEIAKIAIARLMDKQADVEERADAGFALGNLGDAAIPYAKALGNLLRESEIQDGIIFALGNLGNAATPYAPDFLEIARNEQLGDPPRYASVEALAKLDAPATPYANDLLAIAQDKDIRSSVRDKALEALGESGSAANYAKPLSDILRDRSNAPFPACGAAQALGTLGDAAIPYVAELGKFVLDQSLDVGTRQCAAMALGNLGNVSTPYAQALVEVIKNKNANSEQRWQAAELLASLGNASQPYIGDLVEILQDQRTDSELRLNIASTLENCSDAIKPYADALLNVVQAKQTEPAVQYQTVLALGKSDKAVQTLLRLLKDPTTDLFVRDAAAGGLGNLGEAIKPYARDIVEIAKTQGNRQFIRDVNFVSRTKGYGLKNLGSAAAPYAQDLSKIVKDQHFRFQVRLEAAQALMNLGNSAKPYTKEIVSVVGEAIQRSPGDMSPLYLTQTLSLNKLAPFQADDLRPLVDQLANGNQRELGQAYARFLVYFYTGGDQTVIAQLKRSPP